MKKLLLALVLLAVVAVAFFGGMQFTSATQHRVEKETYAEWVENRPTEELPEVHEEPEETPELEPEPTPEPIPEPEVQADDDLAELFGGATYAIGCLGYDWQMPAEHPEYDFIGLAGDEYYYIVPLEQESSIAIYEDEMEGEKTLIYASAQARPMVVRGNQSDIFANMYIVLTAPDGTVTEINPFISLKDGSVVIGDNAVLLPVASLPKSALE